MALKRKFTYDVNTRNISFIQTAVDLKRRGIKNNMFFLKIYDRSLIGVDPFSVELTQDQVIRITHECYINPWYFLRECVRIPDQGNPAGIPYQLNRANLAMTWCFLNGIDTDTVIPRQVGKTQSALSILDWSFLYGTTNSEMMFLNIDAEKSRGNLARLKDQRELLPPYLQMKVAYDDNGKEITGTNNVTKLSNASNKNSIVVRGGAQSVEKAESVGRGSTQPIQYIDEFEFIPHIKTIMGAAGPAFSTASKNAARNHAMYGRIITSTPGDLDARSGVEAAEIIEQMCSWSEKFYDMEIDEVKEYIETNSGNGIVYIEYQYWQLGKDENWFRDVCRKLNNDKLKIKREIFLKRIHGSSESPYPAEDLEAIDELRGTIIEELFINQIFKIDVYKALDKNRIYFVGVDVANGYGGDNSSITIFDPYELKAVAEFKSPLIGVKALIKLLYVLIRKYLPRSILIIERNMNGEAVIDHLRDTEIRGNLYFDNSKDIVGADIDDKLDAEGMLKREAARRRFYGVYTQGKAREAMFALLDEYIKNKKDSFVCNYLISDIMKLVRKRGGRIEAGPGAHDDNVMSFLMCLYVYYHGNNLYRYGFSRGKLPTEEERNKGLSYDGILAQLSETDRKYFENTGYSSFEYEQSYKTTQTEVKNKGFIDNAELRSAYNEVDERTDTINPLDRMSPYERAIYMETRRAERESLSFDKAHGLSRNYEMLTDDIDEDYESSFDQSFFTELNS